MGEGGTLLVATGLDRRTLITVAGKNDRKVAGNPTQVADPYVPVGANRLKLASTAGLKAGDTIVIRRPSTADWIKQLGMADLGGGMGSGWRPGTRDLAWDRTITAVDGDTITLDAPLTNSLDAHSAAEPSPTYNWPGRITNVGVENLRCESTFDATNPKDEAHSWIAISMDQRRDAWVRQVTSRISPARRSRSSRPAAASPSKIANRSRRFPRSLAIVATHFSPAASRRCSSDAGPNTAGTISPSASAPPVPMRSCNATHPGAGRQRADRQLGTRHAVRQRAHRRRSAEPDGPAVQELLRRLGGGQLASSGNATASQINCFDPPGAHNWCFGSWSMFAGDSLFLGFG